MSKHAILYPLLGLGLLACVVWIVKQEISMARAEERSQAHSDAIKEIQKVQAAADKVTKDALDKLAAEKKKPATVQTVIKYLPAPTPEGSSIVVKQTPEQKKEGTGDIVLTGNLQKNLDWSQGVEIAHKECDTKLDSCQKDVTFAGQKLAEMTKDRDNWESTAKNKPRGFFNRVKQAGKCAWKPGLGALIGAAWGYKGAAIGGTAGGVACTF